jgi:hypothetical protein
MGELPNFIQILPKLHPIRICTNLPQIRRQERFPMNYLWTLLIKHILINGALISSTPGLESTSGDVVLEEFFVDDVDNGGDQLLYVFGAGLEGVDIARGEVKEGVEVGDSGGKGGVEGFAVDVFDWAGGYHCDLEFCFGKLEV